MSISKNPGNPTYTNTSFSKEEIQFGKSQVMHVIKRNYNHICSLRGTTIISVV